MLCPVVADMRVQVGMHKRWLSYSVSAEGPAEPGRPEPGVRDATMDVGVLASRMRAWAGRAGQCGMVRRAAPRRGLLAC